MENRREWMDRWPIFVLYAFPVYWLFALLVIVLAIWKTGFIEDLLPLALLIAAILVAAWFLTMGKCWASIFMILLGSFVALQKDQHTEHLFQLYGVYLMLHYIVCGVHAFKNRKKE